MNVLINLLISTHPQGSDENFMVNYASRFTFNNQTSALIHEIIYLLFGVLFGRRKKRLQANEQIYSD